MADYTDILPERVILTRTPAAADRAVRTWQEGHLVIKEGGTVSIAIRSYHGGDSTPSDEWHNRTLAFRLASAKGGACMLDIDRLRIDLAKGGRLSRLIDRIVRGHTVEWDGNNHVGTFEPDAGLAFDDLQCLLDSDDYASETEVWDVGHYLLAMDPPEVVLRDFGLTAEATDAEIADRARTVAENAEAQGIVLIGDAEKALREIAEMVRS